MKYLKHFESVDSDYHVQAIKDVFQDIIDEYDLEEYNPSTEDIFGFGGEPLTFFYKIGPLKGSPITSGIRSNKIELGMWAQKDFVLANFPKIDISGHIKRLESMGYIVTYTLSGKKPAPKKYPVIDLFIDYSNI